MRYEYQNLEFIPSLSLLLSYLTKIADQLVAVISSDQGKGIAWNEDAEEDDMDVDEDPDTDEEDERLYTFQVSKTNEQEESVNTRPGFEARSSFLYGGRFLIPP